jgi:hypothetical protein
MLLVIGTITWLFLVIWDDRHPVILEKIWLAGVAVLTRQTSISDRSIAMSEVEDWMLSTKGREIN